MGIFASLPRTRNVPLPRRSLSCPLGQSPPQTGQKAAQPEKKWRTGVRHESPSAGSELESDQSLIGNSVSLVAGEVGARCVWKIAAHHHRPVRAGLENDAVSAGTSASGIV